MKNIIIKIFYKLIKPFIGSGIGNYFPFNKIHDFYIKVTTNNCTKERIKTIYGFEMYVNVSGQIIETSLANNGYWEKEVSDFMLQYLKPGMTFLDVGANIGYHSLLAATILKESGEVISFEPESRNFKVLTDNIKINNFDKKVTIHNLALGEENEKKTIIYNPENPGMTSFIDSFSGISSNLAEIVVYDEFMGNKKIDFIKIDVEGYEFDVLKGMKKLLGNIDYPKFIILELSPLFYEKRGFDKINYTLDILMFLNKNNYKIHLFSNEIIEEKDFPQFIKNIEKQIDIYCVKY